MRTKIGSIVRPCFHGTRLVGPVQTPAFVSEILFEVESVHHDDWMVLGPKDFIVLKGLRGIVTSWVLVKV